MNHPTRLEPTLSAELFARHRTSTGERLDELSAEAPLLVVFLRHSGCPFCRQTLADLAETREEIESAGTRIALVHMMNDDQAAAMFAEYGLADVPRVSDPDRELYRAFHVERGAVKDVAGPGVWWRGFKATILERHGFGRPQGDTRQLGAAVLLREGQVDRAFRHSTSADRPDYVDLASCPVPGSSSDGKQDAD